MEIRRLTRLPALGPLFARALAPSLDRGPARVPAWSAQVTGIGQDVERLAEYQRVCGFDIRDAVPATWLHVLTFPLHVALLSSSDSNVRLAGVVHVSNRMRLHRAVTADEVLDLTVGIERLRPHARGALLDLVGSIRSGSDLVWEGVSTYLAPGARVSGSPDAPVRSPFETVEPIAGWQLPADLGRQYRRVSGDPNPIHTSRLAARAFGFARPIIHGMWTHARLLAAIESRLPSAYSAEVDFTKPILLPTTVGAWWHHDGDDWRAAVTTTDGTKPHLLMTVAP